MGIFDKLFGKKDKDDLALIDAAKEGHTKIIEMLLTLDKSPFERNTILSDVMRITII